MSAVGEWWRRRWRALSTAVVAVALLSSPWWGRRVARELDFFRVRRVEIIGARYLARGEIVSRLRVDTLASVWDDPAPLERRVAGHPQVRNVTIDRKLPGTLVVRVDENLPVALVPSAAQGFRAYDSEGRVLPLDPSRVAVDLPIVARRDTTIFRLLAEVRAGRPKLFARISEVRRTSRAELLLQLDTLPVRAMADVSLDRLDDIAPVETDLAKRRARVAELDLRFRDQVIARLQ